MAGELIVFPDPVRATFTHLAARLAEVGYDVAVVGRVPEARPEEFVLVRPVGGADRDLVSIDALLTVEAYARTLDRATSISWTCHGIMRLAAREGWLADAPIRLVETVSLPQDLPDPLAVGQERVTATYSVTFRGSAAE